jgi:hypothetical protein
MTLIRRTFFIFVQRHGLYINVGGNIIFVKMRTIYPLIIVGITIISCRTIKDLDSEKKAIFCQGAQNIVHYAKVNNNLPDRISVKFPSVTTPDHLVLADISPELKAKVLKDKNVSTKLNRTNFYRFDCRINLESIDKPLIDYYFQYDALDNIIVLGLGTVNDKSHKIEHFYFIGLLDSQGKIKEIQASNWVEK